MIDLLRQIRNSKFVRDVAIVATGTAGAQIINVVFLPLITRLYGPEAFGVLGVFMSVAGILIPIAALTYPLAIVLPEEDRDAKALIILSILISFLLAVIVGVVLLQFKDWIVPRFGLESVGDFLLLLPLVMVFSACSNVAMFWLIRKKLFKLTAKIAVAQAALNQWGQGRIRLVQSNRFSPDRCHCDRPFCPCLAIGHRYKVKYHDEKQTFSRHRPRLENSCLQAS